MVQMLVLLEIVLSLGLNHDLLFWTRKVQRGVVVSSPHFQQFLNPPLSVGRGWCHYVNIIIIIIVVIVSIVITNFGPFVFLLLIAAAAAVVASCSSLSIVLSLIIFVLYVWGLCLIC